MLKTHFAYKCHVAEGYDFIEYTTKDSRNSKTKICSSFYDTDLCSSKQRSKTKQNRQWKYFLLIRPRLWVLSRFSHVQHFVTPGTGDRQAPLSMGFSKQECWSGLSFPSPGDLPDPGIEPTSLTSNQYWQAGSLPLAPPGKPKGILNYGNRANSLKESLGRNWLKFEKKMIWEHQGI